MRRPRRIRSGVVATFLSLTLVLFCCIGGVVAFLLNASSEHNNKMATVGCGTTTTLDVNIPLPSITSLGPEQVKNAAVIIKVGQTMQVPPRGWVIAIATALQESGLRNLPNLGARNDHDSVGLFQQRPSQGWGSVEQIMNPEYSSTKFYEHLLKVNGWQTMALTDAAQAVQRSAFPNAYAKHEPLATTVVNALAGGAARAVGSLTTMKCAGPGEIAASGWVAPVPGGVISGFRTPSRPTHQGVDLQASRFTPIHAAAAGVVIKMRCDARTASGAEWGCSRDGSPNILGCGWFVDILHAGNFATRYCHMVTQPMVSVGQQVAPGQQIGLVGTTGHSSGPHLHFETHINGDTSSKGAVDPIAFMQQRGAPLGVSP